MKMIIKSTILLSSTFMLVNCIANIPILEPSTQLVWQDEFEGPAGQSPDSTRWVFDVGTHWGNNQLEYDNKRPESVSLDGQGNLAITARKEQYKGQNYTSGRIKTKDLFETTYGRVEARIMMPSGQGLWPAFWMLGNNFDSVGWPACGEIDIMEYLGQEPNIVHGTLHGPGHSGSKGKGTSFKLTDGRFDTDFHIFAIEWRPDLIQWSVDDQVFQTLTPSDVKGTWVYNHPFFILLNLAVGGNWVGSPDETTTFPQTLLIDYVRVYK